MNLLLCFLRVRICDRTTCLYCCFDAEIDDIVFYDECVELHDPLWPKTKTMIKALKVDTTQPGHRETNAAITNGLIDAAYQSHRKDNFDDWDDMVDAFDRSDYKYIIMRLSLNLPLSPDPFPFFISNNDNQPEVCNVYR